MFFLSPKVKVITHNGGFHTDDIFAVATLSILLGGKIKIIRTRDKEKIAIGDYVVDVGNVYNPIKNRFDHHQQGGAGIRPNGVSFASFGLVWKHFGDRVCDSSEIAKMVDSRLVQPIDVVDNGDGNFEEILPSVFPYTINEIIDAFNLTCDESKKNNSDRAFLFSVKIAKEIILREIKWARVRFETKEIIKHTYDESKDKRIVLIDRECPYDEFISSYPEPLFIVHQYPDGDWSARAVREEPRQFKSRKLFPEAWAGKRDKELSDITGVSDAVFCHNKRFMVVAKSKEGALKLAKLALESKV